MWSEITSTICTGGFGRTASLQDACLASCTARLAPSRASQRLGAKRGVIPDQILRSLDSSIGRARTGLRQCVRARATTTQAHAACRPGSAARRNDPSRVTSGSIGWVALSVASPCRAAALRAASRLRTHRSGNALPDEIKRATDEYQSQGSIHRFAAGQLQLGKCGCWRWEWTTDMKRYWGRHIWA